MFARPHLAWIAAAVLLALARPPARADTPADLRAFLIKYRCDIYDRLVQIHDHGDPQSDSNRFIAVSVPRGHYVQCMFHDGTRKLFCEAASGFYEAPAGARRTAYLPPEAVAGLASSASRPTTRTATSRSTARSAPCPTTWPSPTSC